MNSSNKIARRTERVVSIDFKENLKARFHDNAHKARIDILKLLGETEYKEKDINFTNTYITPTVRNKYKPTVFKKRFQFLWESDYDPNNLPPYLLNAYEKTKKVNGGKN